MISGVLWFGLFPYAQHTITNITLWIEDVFKATSLEKSMILTVTPDGAAGVAGAIGRIGELKPKLETYENHSLARAFVYATGTEGKSSLKPDFKTTLKKNCRLAQLQSQSNHFCRELAPVLG